MTIDKNQKILFWTIPIILLVVVSVRLEAMDQRDSAFPFLIAITWVCVVARYYYSSLDSSMICFAVSWLLGFVGFYGALWTSVLDSEIFRRVVQLEIVGVFAYIAYDYLRLGKRMKYRVVVSGGFVLLIVYLVWSNVFRYKIPSERLDDVVQVGIILIALMVGMSYWTMLRGKG